MLYESNKPIKPKLAYRQSVNQPKGLQWESTLDWLIDWFNPPSKKLPHGDDFRVGPKSDRTPRDNTVLYLPDQVAQIDPAYVRLILCSACCFRTIHYSVIGPFSWLVDWSVDCFPRRNIFSERFWTVWNRGGFNVLVGLKFGPFGQGGTVLKVGRKKRSDNKKLRLEEKQSDSLGSYPVPARPQIHHLPPHHPAAPDKPRSCSFDGRWRGECSTGNKKEGRRPKWPREVLILSAGTFWTEIPYLLLTSQHGHSTTKIREMDQFSPCNNRYLLPHHTHRRLP